MNNIYTKNSKGSIYINNYDLRKAIEGLGYATFYFTDDKTEKPIYIHKEVSIIEPVAPLQIHKKFIKEIELRSEGPDSIPSTDRSIVLDKLIRSKSITSNELLITLPELDGPIITDTNSQAFFYYNNGIVTVSRENIEYSPPEEIKGYVWSSQIIDREIHFCSEEETERSDYYQFMKSITSTRTQDGWIEDPDRFNSLFSLHGYMLHSYKDRSNPRAVVLMDSSQSHEPSGRTGKGLIVEALRQFRKTIVDDGKNFDPRNRFKYSSITPDTKILFIDDVSERFDFEALFSVITEGITVEGKYSNKFFIPYEQSPKVILSTNYALTGIGSSHEARKYEYALSNYYSDKHRPIDEFGRMFFSGWDANQWTYFDNLMFYSVQYYLRNGVIIPPDLNIQKKKLITDTSYEFSDWVSDVNFVPDKKYVTSELHEHYMLSTNKDITRKTFLEYIREFASYKGWHLEQFHSGYIRYFEFVSNGHTGSAFGKLID